MSGSLAAPGSGPVLVVPIGGTIAMAPSTEGGLAIGPGIGALIAVLGDQLPAKVELEHARAVPSSQLSLDDVVELARLLRDRLDSGRYVGAVVTQGTDTMEESAFALDLLVGSPLPVVVTGAMRAPSQLGSDALANLVGAVATAASAEARSLGTVVVMNDEIHAARFVRKAHTSSPAAFVSTPGPLGWIAEGRPRIALRPMGAMSLPGFPEAPWAGSVPLVPVGIGDDGTVLASFTTQSARGLVVAALGAGHVPERLVDPLGQLAAELPVVLASRSSAGGVLENAYDFPGSERDLLDRGLIPGQWLNAWKCRILLELLLRLGVPSVRAAFTRILEQAVSAGSG